VRTSGETTPSPVASDPVDDGATGRRVIGGTSDGFVGPGPRDGVTALAALRSWDRRRWWAAVVAAVLTAVIVGVPTDVIPNPVFGRPVAVTWWSAPVLAFTSVLAGLLAATYVRTGSEVEADQSARMGGVGGVLAYLAVGCPVCNKLVLLALGTTGAMEFFAPVQPVLAVAGVVVLAVALRFRLRSSVACPVRTR